MDSRSAEDHLRVIRELMERATIYRTISAPAALFCGFLALFVAFAALIRGPLQPILRHSFVQVWIIVFLLSAAANTLFFAPFEQREKGSISISTLADGAGGDRTCVSGRRCANDLARTQPGIRDFRRGLLDRTLRVGSFIDGDLCPAFDRGARMGVCAYELSWPWLVDARLSFCLYG